MALTRRGLATGLGALAACGERTLALVRPLPDAGGADAGEGVNVDVAWDRPTGRNVPPLLGGLSLVKAADPDTAAESAYRANVAAMRPPFVRVHGAVTASSTDVATGWVVEPDRPTYRWDRTKIARAFEGARMFPTETMVTIPGWPLALGAANVPLPAAEEPAFAAFCADLVRALNLEQQRAVRRFELFHAADGVYRNEGAAFGRIVRSVALAMKAVDPSIQVGAAGFTHPYLDLIDDMLATAGDALDFVSFQAFATGDVSLPFEDALDATPGLATRVRDLATRVSAQVPRALGIVVSQWALNWNRDPRVADERGAVFDALALMELARAPILAAAAWNESDGWYGKLDAAHAMRPSAHVFALWNRHVTGAIVDAESASPAVVPFATVGGGVRTLVLVNRGAAALSVRAPLPGPAVQVSAAGLELAAPTAGTLRMPPLSVIVATSG